MQFGFFYEHQLPRPWQDGQELQLFQEALDHVELADQIGIEYAWVVEHHFLEEYSHSSAPEVFLAACSQRTKNILLGHGIMLMLPGYNHPARAAERIATLDLLSKGRVQWGTGKSSSRIELEGFNIPPEQRHEMWYEAVRETAKMLAATPYPGYDGKYFSMPQRNIVPKPVQKPHPPLWMACSSKETIIEAARCGCGALCFTFADPSEAKYWVDTYYTTFKNECKPIGQAVNPNIAMAASFMCHEDSAVAVQRGLEGAQFFSYSLNHYYGYGSHLPGKYNLWEDFQAQRAAQNGRKSCIGSPGEVRDHLMKLEEAGVDQVIFVQQVGNNQQAHMLHSLELFGEQLMPEFKQRDRIHQERKAQTLAPSIAQAMNNVIPVPQVDSVPVDAYPLLSKKMAQVNEKSTVTA